MEKLDKVIADMTCCVAGKCAECSYGEMELDECQGALIRAALLWLKEQNRLIKEPSSNIPCCDNCGRVIDSYYEDDDAHCARCGAHMDEEVARETE